MYSSNTKLCSLNILFCAENATAMSVISRGVAQRNFEIQMHTQLYVSVQLKLVIPSFPLDRV